jgi:hypothetical protein
MHPVRTLLWVSLSLAPGALAAQAAGPRPPVIDMHLHAQRLWLPAGTVDPVTGLQVPASAEELRTLTVAALERYNVVRALVSGPMAEEYRAAAPAFRPGYELGLPARSLCFGPVSGPG